MKYLLVSGNNIYLNRKGAGVFEDFAVIGRAVIKDLYSSKEKWGGFVTREQGCDENTIFSINLFSINGKAFAFACLRSI
jgi:hypothetical protein